MVADSKRKETRKRKYAHLRKTQIVEDENINLETLDAGSPPPKKASKNSNDAVAAPPNEPVASAEENANSDAPDLDTQEAADIHSSPPAKTARFLCFIGMSLSSPRLFHVY